MRKSSLYAFAGVFRISSEEEEKKEDGRGGDGGATVRWEDRVETKAREKWSRSRRASEQQTRRRGLQEQEETLGGEVG